MLEFVVGVFCVKHHLIMSVLCQTASTACIGVRCGCSLLCMHATFVLDAAILLFYVHCGHSLLSAVVPPV